MKTPSEILEAALEQLGHDYPAAQSVFNAIEYLATGKGANTRGLANAMRPYTLVDADRNQERGDFDRLGGALALARIEMLDAYKVFHGGELVVNIAQFEAFQ